MTKKIVMAVIMATALSATGISQETTAAIPTIPQEKTKRNELGLNIASAASILLGAEPYTPKLSLNFKRIVHENKALRFAASYQFKWVETSLHNIYNYDILSQTDSTQIRRNKQSDNGGRMQVNAGYEWRKGKKKLKYFFGADLIAGHTSHIYSVFDQAYKLEQIYPFRGSPTEDTLFRFEYDPNTPTMFVTSEKTNYYYVGLGPFFGLTYPLSKRFSISAQTGVDIRYSFGKTVTKDYFSKISNSRSYGLYEFSTSGIVNDLSLIYKF